MALQKITFMWNDIANFTNHVLYFLSDFTFYIILPTIINQDK